MAIIYIVCMCVCLISAYCYKPYAKTNIYLYTYKHSFIIIPFNIWDVGGRGRNRKGAGGDGREWEGSVILSYIMIIKLFCSRFSVFS